VRRVAVLLAAALPFAVSAQSRDVSRLDGDAGSRIDGVASLNLAAGTGNAQANLRAVGIADAGLASVLGRQSTDAASADRSRDARALIGGNALGAASGLLGLNQAAGSANAQANLLAIGNAATLGFVQQVDNAALAATAAPTAAADAPLAPTALREARIDAGAIASPRGVLQINQTAGVGNASANAIVLQLPGGTP
jgi:hypothetical protein